MFQKAFFILHDPDDAEDAVQNAFLRILHHLDKLHDPNDKMTKWYVIEASKNAAIDLYWIRKHKRKKEDCFYENIMYEDPMEKYQGENKVIDLIMSFSSRDRDILMLKYIYGYKYAEVAKALGISENAAKKAGERAKEKLESLCRMEGLYQ